MISIELLFLLHSVLLKSSGFYGQQFVAAAEMEEKLI